MKKKPRYTHTCRGYLSGLKTASEKCYNLFKRIHPNVKMTHRQHRDCIEKLNIKYIQHIITTGHTVTLPYGLGKLGVVKTHPESYRLKSDSPSFYKYPTTMRIGETTDTGKVVYMLNEHTDGYVFRYRWYKGNSRIKMPVIWKVSMSRFAKNMLRDSLMDKNGDRGERFPVMPPARKMEKRLKIWEA